MYRCQRCECEIRKGAKFCTPCGVTNFLANRKPRAPKPKRKLPTEIDKMEAINSHLIADSDRVPESERKLVARVHELMEENRILREQLKRAAV